MIKIHYYKLIRFKTPICIIDFVILGIHKLLIWVKSRCIKS